MNARKSGNPKYMTVSNEALRPISFSIKWAVVLIALAYYDNEHTGGGRGSLVGNILRFAS